MIVVDTSALMAIVLGEAESGACMDALEAEGEVLISAGTLAEALIVARRRGVFDEVSRLIEDLAFTIVPVTGATARRMEQAHGRWGKGVRGLNFGDCFAYATAKDHGCPLLFVGKDFSRTDVIGALG